MRYRKVDMLRRSQLKQFRVTIATKGQKITTALATSETDLLEVNVRSLGLLHCFNGKFAT